MTEQASAVAMIEKIQRLAFVAGAVGLVLCLIGAATDLTQFYQSYLLAWLFWLGVAAGSLALLMIQHLTGGSWGYVIRRILEASTRTLPLLAVLVVPLWLGIPRIYHWAHPEFAHGDRILEQKVHYYLNIPFFIGRTAFYLALWMLLAYLLNKWSREQDETGDPGLATKMESLSGPGLAIFGLVATFSAIDWGMTLEPHWFSTMYGLQFALGQALCGLALAIVAVWRLSEHEPISKVIGPDQFHDLGNLLLAFVMLWAYLTFSQFLIIWSGNLPEEIPWYLNRTSSGWQVIALALVIFHWALPFLILLSRGVKRAAYRLGMLALAMIMMRMLDLFWLIKPAFHPGDFSVSWLDVCWLAGLGGVWMGYFCLQLKSRPLLPVNDPAGEKLAANRAHGQGHGMETRPEHIQEKRNGTTTTSR